MQTHGMAEGAHLQHVGAPHHVIDAPEAHGSHELAQLLRHQEKEIDHVLRLPRKFGAQLGILHNV